MGNSSYIDILFTALGGIDGSVMPIIWFIANSILAVTFLWGVYDAFVRGGDVRSLGITMLKYAAVALVLMNWAATFRDVVKSFDYVSNYIYETNGLGDVVSAWTNGLATTVEQQRRFEHVEVDRRRHLGPDYRTRFDHRLHRSSFQPRNLHDLFRVLGIHLVCSGPPGNSNYAEFNARTFPLSLD